MIDIIVTAVGIVCNILLFVMYCVTRHRLCEARIRNEKLFAILDLYSEDSLAKMGQIAAVLSGNSQLDGVTCRVSPFVRANGTPVLRISISDSGITWHFNDLDQVIGFLYNRAGI